MTGWSGVGVEVKRRVSDAEFADMETFVRDYLAASVENEEDGGRMRWYPWHSAAYRFNHTLNVVDLAGNIAAEEGATVDVTRVAALFHDVAKLEADQEVHDEEGARVAREYLETHGDYAPSFVDAVCESVANHTYQGDLNDLDPETRSLIEADMLDKVGANGTALLLLRMGYEARTHMDTVDMVQRVIERGRNVQERLVSRTAKDIAHRRITRAEWFQEWLELEVAEMTLPEEDSDDR
jgi:uncharacterized protein